MYLYLQSSVQHPICRYMAGMLLIWLKTQNNRSTTPNTLGVFPTSGTLGHVPSVKFLVPQVCLPLLQNHCLHSLDAANQGVHTLLMQVSFAIVDSNFFFFPFKISQENTLWL